LYHNNNKNMNELTIYDKIELRLLLSDAIQEYQDIIKENKADSEPDFDYGMYYKARIIELEKIKNKL